MWTNWWNLLREGVTEKLDELLQAEVFEKAQEGLSSWIPLVVVPKSDGDFRICVDMCPAN